MNMILFTVQSAKLRKYQRAQTSETLGNRNRFLSVSLTRSGREGFSGEDGLKTGYYLTAPQQFRKFITVSASPESASFGYFSCRNKKSAPPEEPAPSILLQIIE